MMFFSVCVPQTLDAFKDVVLPVPAAQDCFSVDTDPENNLKEGRERLSLCVFAAHGLGFWTDRSAVHEAAAQGRALQLQQLIEGGAAVNIVAVDSITPLHEACIQGQSHCVRLLLEAGAQVRCCWCVVDNKNKNKPAL